MSAPGRHLQIRLDDNRVIAQTIQQRQLVAKVVLKHGRHFNLLAFGLADTHLHVESVCSKEMGSELARRIKLSLHRLLQLKTGFARAYNEPIRDARHLYNTFYYTLSQPIRHVSELDPYFTGSNLPDLLGLRVTGAFTIDTVRRILPRVSAKDLFLHLRVSSLQPADGPVEFVPFAAQMASGLDDFRGKSPEKNLARLAIIHVIGDRLSTRKIGNILGVSERTIYKQKTAGNQPSKLLVRAIRLQLGLIQSKGGAAAQPHLPSAQRPPLPMTLGSGCV